MLHAAYSRSRPPARVQGFTLVETLVVIAIIGMFMSIMLPAIQHVRAAVDKMQCLDRMRQIGIALHLYHGDYNHLPPGRHPGDGQPAPYLQSQDNLLSWRVLLTPYLEQDALYHTALDDVARNPQPWRHAGQSTVVKIFTCPADSRLGTAQMNEDGIPCAFSSYVGVSGHWTNKNGMFASPSVGPGRRFADCTDGVSNTLLVGERPPPDSWRAGQWYSRVWYFKYGDVYGPDHVLSVRQIPYGITLCGEGRYGPGRTDNLCDHLHFWSLHSRGANFLFLDGSARLLPYHIGDEVLSALASRNGGEVVDPDW